MARITLFDCCRFKFCKELISHWEKLGHEVRKSIYWDPKLVEWSDITFFDWADNSLIRATNPDDPLYKENNLTIPFGRKHIVCRCHDIDAWCGHYARINWEFVDDLIFVGKHIQDLVLENLKKPDNLKIHLVKHGIDMDKYTLRKSPKNNKIAWVGRITHHKCIELALQVLAENPSYELHAVGTSLDSWELAYVNDFVQRNNLKFFHYNDVLDINEFLEDKTYILLTSFKEAFSFISAEAMAKGLKPLIHWFYGAENVWDKKYLWNKVSDAKKLLEEEYKPEEYREYIKNNYPLDKMMDKYDEILKIK